MNEKNKKEELLKLKKKQLFLSVFALIITVDIVSKYLNPEGQSIITKGLLKLGLGDIAGIITFVVYLCGFVAIIWVADISSKRKRLTGKSFKL